MSLARLKNRVYRQVAEIPEGVRLRDIYPPEPRTTCRISKSRAQTIRRVHMAIDALLDEGRIERCGVLDSELRVTRAS